MSECPQCASPCDASHKFCPACGYPIGAVAKSEDDPLIGSTLPGGYVILELIGGGGMGRVYRAEQTALGRTVAVKIVHPYLLGDESAAARFITEARAASLLNHPNSVSVIDFGKTDSGQLYLVMEHLRGRDVARVVYEDGALSFHRIIDILRQVLAALSEAHHLGIIHRDLKPENIVIEPMRTGGDFVKVVDFGLAKLLTEVQKSPAITAAGIVCGTPDYMAPEQGRGDALDARSDLYAVGVILFQLLTGRLPFEADSPTQVVLMHLTVPPPDPREVAPERGIPEGLARANLRALSKNPEERHQDADTFSTALASVKTQLESVRPSLEPRHHQAVGCPECGALLPPTQRFCGECGARVDSSSDPGSLPPSVAKAVKPPDTATRRKTLSAPKLPMPLVGRDDDVAWLLDRLSEASSSFVGARIIGAAGIGKTRLMEEFLGVAMTDGEVMVVRAGPDPWWAEVSYFCLRSLIRQLASLPEDGATAAQWEEANAEARTGLSTIFGPSLSRQTLDPGICRRNAAEALRWSLGRAASSSGKKILIFVDDVHSVDGASRNAIADVLGEPPELPALIVGAQIAGFETRWPGSFPARVLEGFDAETAKSLVRGTSNRDALQDTAARNVPPMYVEQLIRFTAEGGTAPPPRLADLIGLRIARLEADARRVLQGVAVLGSSVKKELISKLVEGVAQIDASVNELVTAGMVADSDKGVSIPHPLLREIAQVTVPAGVRRELHDQAGLLAASLNVPIEVRALHAMGAQDAFEALLLLDQIGARALARDDVSSAILAYRRGLELARREIFRGELDDPMRAVLIFSRKLGDALAQAGDVTDAEGVLREALDLAAPTGEDRAKVLFALASVAQARHRDADAMRYLREAIEIAHRSGAHELVESFEEQSRAWAS